MEPRQLRAFLAIADTGSVSAASRELGYSQSALSRQLAALERQLGGQVFERRRDGMMLTDEGNVLYEHARNLLERFDGFPTIRDVSCSSGPSATAASMHVPHHTPREFESGLG